MEYIEILLKNMSKKSMSAFIDSINYIIDDIGEIHYHNETDGWNNKITKNELKKLINNDMNINIMFKKVCIWDIDLENVMMMVMMENKVGDILFNFNTTDFFNMNIQNIAKILDDLKNISIMSDVGEILLGYEPVDNTDMQMVIFNDGDISLCNTEYFVPYSEKIFYCLK